MERRLYATVPQGDDGKKLKEFLRARWRLSAALLIALKRWEDGLQVNGMRRDVNTVLRRGDTVSISVGDHGADSGFEETAMPLDVLYEDLDFIAINKPPFLAVHPSKGHCSDTLANGLTAYYHEKGETFVSRCILRLDRNTSGVVLFAKNAYAHDMLRRQLGEGEVKKEYVALVHGRPEIHGTVDAPIYRPEQATLQRVVDPRGQASFTEYDTVRSNGRLSLLRVFPRTGRTHQIRLHLSYAGFPLVSDFLYGDENDGILSRHGLHCASVSFRHPITGKTVCIKAPLAEDLASACEDLVPVERYRTLDGFLRQTYGEKLVKLSLSSGCSCPNREQGKRGCSFCSGGGNEALSVMADLPIPEQLSRAKALMKQKWRDCRYIAYFQTYTNTYAPIDRLRTLFFSAIKDPQVAVLSVATRPDCLAESVLDLLSELNEIKPVWVELGLQTADDAVASRLNRGYPRSVYEDAVVQLRARGIYVVTHLIFGLPGESCEDMIASASYAGRWTDGIKIQMLQILQGSVLAEEYQTAPFPLLSREEYCSAVWDALTRLPPQVTVHRLTGDPPAELLIAPAWTKDKKGVLAALRAEGEARNAVQGMHCTE